MEKCLDCFETSLRETREALHQTQQTLQAIQEVRAEDRAILDRLCKHLMGPIDVKDYGIPSSSFSRGRGSPGAGGVLVPIGAQELEGAPMQEGRLCEHPLSLLRGGMLAPRLCGSRMVI